MAKCEWCNKNVNSLNVITDSFGEVQNVCDSCKESHSANECIVCGSVTDMILKGRCMNCYQAILHTKAKKKEEALNGVMGTDEYSASISSELELTEEDYERWLTMGNTVSPKDIKEDVRLRRMWIIVKLSTAGIDMDLINEYAPIVEELLETCFSKLIRNKCRIVIANNSETKKLVKSGTIIDYKDDVYILKL